MFPLFIGAAIIGGCVGIFFLRAKRRPPAQCYSKDAMATEKTAEGIRKFAADIAKLEKVVASKIN